MVAAWAGALKEFGFGLNFLRLSHYTIRKKSTEKNKQMNRWSYGVNQIQALESDFILHSLVLCASQQCFAASRYEKHLQD
jgi:hypothetical protein